ncbi:MAG: hypothetical protein ACLSAH_17125 [Bilophila wadsworthia]
MPYRFRRNAHVGQGSRGRGRESGNRQRPGVSLLPTRKSLRQNLSRRQAGGRLSGRHCRTLVKSECPFCGIQEPLQAQRDNPGLCIVVRHIPSDEYGESLKKALSYESLKTFSVNAAHRFWDAVLPKTSLGIPVPYEAALQTAIQEAAIAPEAFADALQAAAPLVGADIVAAQSRITSTPTWILEGIRFPACDFKAAELPVALELARKTRSGDTDAQERVVEIITRGLLNEPLI